MKLSDDQRRFAAELVMSNPEAWTSGWMYRDKSGYDPEDGTFCKACAIGMLCSVENVSAHTYFDRFVACANDFGKGGAKDAARRVFQLTVPYSVQVDHGDFALDPKRQAKWIDL